MTSGEPLDRSFFQRSSIELAPALLNKVLSNGKVSGRIVETEAYDGIGDPASHSHRGKTRRNSVMFGPAGHLYVYFTYGMHYCCNVVADREGHGSAVLIRALVPLTGIEQMRLRRASRGRTIKDADLANGPAKTCQALAIDLSHNGLDLLDPCSELRLIDDGVPSPALPECGPRVGIRQGTDLPWRWWV